MAVKVGKGFGVRLGELLLGLEEMEIKGPLDVPLRDISYDSRRVQENSLFVALKGMRADGHDFAAEALRRGASALVLEREVKGLDIPPSVALIRVRDSRLALALISGSFFGHPSREIKVIGVTGTNGKTTTTYLLEAILQEAGRAAGLIGTIAYRLSGRELEAERTTPEPPDLQRMLRQMVEGGADYCVLEVSSHALSLRRVDGCEFEGAIFTNLSQDHLDFHGSLEAYLEAKRRLFEEFPLRWAALNIDDEAGSRLASGFKGKAVTFGLSPAAMVRAEEVSVKASGLSFRLCLAGASIEIASDLTGTHNVANILAASAGAWALGIGLEEVARGVAALKAVPGRFERVDAGQPFTVIVDYAHTEDALRRVLSLAREITPGKVIAVMGCGGNRDRAKRPLMGRAAAELSDLLFITSDNPRDEEPTAIVADVEAGLSMSYRNSGRHHAIVDRREAIGEAIGCARKGDCVVIAGKGHETYQLIRGRTIPFDDREVAREALRQRGYRN